MGLLSPCHCSLAESTQAYTGQEKIIYIRSICRTGKEHIYGKCIQDGKKTYLWEVYTGQEKNIIFMGSICKTGKECVL